MDDFSMRMFEQEAWDYFGPKPGEPGYEEGLARMAEINAAADARIFQNERTYRGNTSTTTSATPVTTTTTVDVDLMMTGGNES